MLFQRKKYNFHFPDDVGVINTCTAKTMLNKVHTLIKKIIQLFGVKFSVDYIGVLAKSLKYSLVNKCFQVESLNI